jgi:hypothetical protein
MNWEALLVLIALLDLFKKQILNLLVYYVALDYIQVHLEENYVQDVPKVDLVIQPACLYAIHVHLDIIQ